ncbi:unnamed protein product, partial [Rotaria magnacalcarata]
LAYIYIYISLSFYRYNDTLSSVTEQGLFIPVSLWPIKAMLRSNLQAGQNQFYAGQRNSNGYNTEQRRVNNQAASFATPHTTNGRPLQNSQFNLQPNQANVQFYNNNNTSLQSQARQTVNGNTYSTTDSILARALPGALSTPKGWHSEVINSSEPAANQVETNLNTDMIETDQAYQNFESS